MSQNNLTRQRLIEECARLMTQDGIDDFQLAKTKAAARLGLPNRHLPSNQEIEQALLSYQRLFRSDSQHQRLREQRQTAVEAMQFLADFEPRLVGPVLSGTAHDSSSIQLHLFADSHEEVGFFLMEQHIPYEVIERRFFDKRGANPQTYPGYSFMAGEEEIVLLVFPHRELRHPLHDPVSGKAMRRADVQAVQRLIAEADTLAAFGL